MSPAHPTPASFEGGYFQTHFGRSLERLLAPIPGHDPTGSPVRGTSAYRALSEARRGDDPSLPMGPWAAELRRSNWPRVSRIIVSVLSEQTKDLQLAAWLLESEIHERGHIAVAPCIALMQALCETFWERLYPRTDDASFEALGNVVRWVDDKLMPALSLAPLVGENEQAVSWSAWEMARRFERIKAVQRELPEEAAEAPTLADLAALVGRQSTDHLRRRVVDLDTAHAAILAFEGSLRAQASDMPSLSRLRGLLERMQSPMREELAQRGVALREPEEVPVEQAPSVDAGGDDVVAAGRDAAADSDAGAGDGHAGTDHDESDDDTSPGYEPLDPVAERQRAYDVLEDIAAFLARIEPHSPVPYLLRRAVLWGGMNSAQLYHAIFVEGGGRLDMLDILGITDGTTSE
ncbi:type VI secretion system protein TssA [Luteibacter sp. 9135]|uniref:type VI secretion system protein TssA n=1 Tax=Luteibacter sp. 9135 TaxID=1500893 RepID=UPI000564CFA6|nr:type VI secretion system protein TssA [Luteibacter sp. 9135]